jgi:hypothetical protein
MAYKSPFCRITGNHRHYTTSTSQLYFLFFLTNQAASRPAANRPDTLFSWIKAEVAHSQDEGADDHEAN